MRQGRKRRRRRRRRCESRVESVVVVIVFVEWSESEGGRAGPMSTVAVRAGAPVQVRVGR